MKRPLFSTNAFPLLREKQRGGTRNKLCKVSLVDATPSGKSECQDPVLRGTGGLSR